MKLRAPAISICIAAVLAVPAAASASNDVAVSQVPSARVVAPGAPVTLSVTVANRGTEASEAVYLNLFSLSGHGQAANNPYRSVTTSQGACKDTTGEAYGQIYYSYVCELGAMAPGVSAKVTAVVTVNQTMNHLAALLPNAYEGGYQDGDNSNNEAVDRVAADIPPTVTGTKKIKVKGLPTGCVAGDFTLRLRTKVRDVKKMGASLFLGFDEEGSGQEWEKVARGKSLVAKVPVSRIEGPELGAFYELKLKAKRGGRKLLKTTVEFQLC